MSVYGRSGANFDLDGAGSEAPVGLRAQVQFHAGWLGGVVRSVRGEGEGEREGEVRVVLVGHSVGAYVALEVLRGVLGGGRKKRGGGDGDWGGVRVVGVVGLWPTVTHIGRSRSGVRVGVSFYGVVCYRDAVVLIVVVEGGGRRAVQRGLC